MKATLDSRMNTALDRIAAATSITRSSREGAEFLELHGGTPAELYARMEQVVGRLEQVATRLEKAAS